MKLTGNAEIKLKKVLPDGGFVRIAVQAGGCSGYEYKLVIEESAKENDIQIEIEKDSALFSNNAITILVDPKSKDILKDVIVDYLETLNGSGFKFINPNAQRTCGCGKSFC